MDSDVKSTHEERILFPGDSRGGDDTKRSRGGSPVVVGGIVVALFPVFC